MILIPKELREFIFYRDNYQCQYPGGCLKRGTEIAHLIANTKGNLKRYGKAVINNPLNLKCSCSPHNSYFNIGNDPGKVQELLEAIHDRRNAH